MRFPITLLEFQTQFPDDEHCWAYLRRPAGRVGSCALAAEAGEATFWQLGVSSSAGYAGIKVR